jgi:hypothetical protein
MPERWTKREIEKLKRLYDSNKKIEAIAAELERSFSSVNKAISRILSSRKRKITKHRRSNIATRYKNTNLPYKQREAKMRGSSSYHAKKEAATIEMIAEYLTSKGYNVSRLPDNGYKFFPEEDDVFAVGNVPMTKMKMLLMANRLRVEDKKPIFVSSDITWH